MTASTPSAPEPTREPHDAVPRSLVLAAAWSWRILVVAAVAAALVAALRIASVVVVPLAVAVLFAALLAPPVRVLTARTPLRRGSASLLVLLVALAAVLVLFGLVATQLASGAGTMRASAESGLEQVVDWLRTGPLKLSSAQLADLIEQAKQSIRGNSRQLTSGLLSVGTSAGHFVAGLLIALIGTFFFLAEGEQIWRFFVRMLPGPAQDPTYEAFRRGWVSLGHYARTQVMVAGVDAIGIGLGALFLRLPFVIPITVLVFLTSFVPIIGAIVSGAVAVLVALVVKGPVAALVMLGVVVLVQQVETHALQPFLMGRAVALHPLAVIAAVAIGSFLLGIVGALFAVPVLAVANTVVRYYAGQDPAPELGHEPMPPAERDMVGESSQEHSGPTDG
ncbi:MAG TPA: AI-2E family transporter [Dermatophilaceae bacterium]|nr:AI-2E family transporter [Dermatophilaceae bacterium]